MDIKKYITILGFTPKDGTSGVYHKIYDAQDNYAIAIDFDKQHIDYGDRIIAESKTTQNFSQPENFVVLECVDRLLQKGYKPQNIILEKTWPSGHGTSGRLDICVNHEDSSPYLLIECKTYGKEFNKELTRIHKDGGQLFTYFQLSGCKADVIMLYSSELKADNLIYANEIIKIEDEYRGGDVKDIYEKWNKLTKDNGIFESWVQSYNFQSKALTKEQLKEIKAEDSSFIFNRFLEILRHNVVSDKGNAFNKIFTLFLCKVYDETTAKAGEELKFQWLEGHDNHIDFQLRLTDLYSKGMKKFLDRTVSDFNDEDFEKRCINLTEDTKRYLRQEVNKLRLEKNNEFAIKEVYDPVSFEENAKVVKEVVELIQGYRIRYNKRQQYLSDFFELLLTTGLKQEAGQFFTPVPIAQFIIKSLPLNTIVANKLERKDGEILPYMIDYAAGSGHFITEYMHEVQSLLNACNKSQYIDETQTSIDTWQKDHFRWATKYVYGVEKDYRLVKVGKVGCYLHGDGLANVILSDGLANFHKNTEYKGKLRKEIDDEQRDNQQFDVLLSNPPYSVSSFRQTTRDYYTEKDFELYSSLTDNSSEIECLFVERTKQLLKDGGVAGVILPSSILSNTGIYTKTREIILQYFDIVAIAELGSNTFMATNTNTVVMFMRRRNNYNAKDIRDAVNSYLTNLVDVTINGIENPVTKYVSEIWEGLSYSDYVTLLQKSPNEVVRSHELYVDYLKKIKDKNQLAAILKIESEKLFYFILTYNQQVVLVRSGEKDAEKRFLGYEFSNRRGSEGIHPIQRGKSIEECTYLFDAESYDNPDKASTYIHRAFCGNFESEIAESMQKNVFRTRLVDMLTFDRVDFDKSISISGKKKIKIDTKWNLTKLEDAASVIRGVTYSKEDQVNYSTSNIILTADNITLDGRLEVTKQIYLNSTTFIDEEKRLKTGDCFICFSSGSKQHVGKVAFVNMDTSYYAGGFMGIIRANNKKALPKYLYLILNSSQIQEIIKDSSSGSNINNLSSTLSEIKIPLPPKNIQEKMINDLEKIEGQESRARVEIDRLEREIEALFSDSYNAATNTYRLSDDKSFSVSIGKRVLTYDLVSKNGIPVYSANVLEPFGNINKFLIENFSIPSILWGIDGDWMVNYIPENIPFYPTDHCGVLRVLSDDICPKYAAWVLRKEGIDKRFSRQLRASINRITSITIKVPSPAKQKEVIVKVEELEKQVANARKFLDTTQVLKTNIIKKY